MKVQNLINLFILLLIAFLLFKSFYPESKDNKTKFQSKNNKNINIDIFTLPIKSNEIETGWQRVFIKDTFCIDIPRTMVVKDKFFYPLIETLNKSLIVFDSISTIIIGQNNQLLEDSLKNRMYSTIIFYTTHAKQNDFQLINFDVNKMSKEEIDIIEKTLKDFTLDGFKEPNKRLIEWYPFKVEIINGMSCYHVSYLRQILDEPLVFVDNYWFPNNNKIHTLVMSYRLSERNFWSKDLKKSLESFRILNIEI